MYFSQQFLRFHSLLEHKPPTQENLKVLMDMISLAISSGKSAALPPLLALECLSNNSDSATVTSPPANSVAGSTYSLLTTENVFNRALPSLTSPADGVDVNDLDVLGSDNDLDGFIGDMSRCDDSSTNKSNDGDEGGGDKVCAQPAEFPYAQLEI